LWVAIEINSKEILGYAISKERNIFLAEKFLSKITYEYGKHPVSTDDDTWYTQSCKFLKLKYHLLPPWRKALLKEQYSM
jgi:putative transposase